MNQLVEKLASLERDISSEKGDFSLFALFLREDSYDRWDLLVSSPWIEINEKKGLEYLVMRINSTFKPHELLSLSRIVILGENEPLLKAIHKAFKVKHGTVELKDNDLFGLDVKQAYIIASEELTDAMDKVKA